MCDIWYEKFVDFLYRKDEKFAVDSVNSNFAHVSYKGSNYI